MRRSSGLVLRFARRQDSLGRLGCSSVIRLPQSFACQRSLVEVRRAIPVCNLVGSAGLCVRAGLCGASDPSRSSAAIRILRGLVVVQTSLVPSREHTLQTVRFRVNNTATIKLTTTRTRTSDLPRVVRAHSCGASRTGQLRRLHVALADLLSSCPACHCARGRGRLGSSQDPRPGASLDHRGRGSGA